MKIISVVKKNIFFFVLASILYFVYATFFLKPWTFQNFSLVDDGQVLVQSSSYFKDCVSSFECSKFIDQTFEFGTGRFRPSYWLINNFVYEIFGNNAQLHHVFRVYFVGYLMVALLIIVLRDLKVGWPFVFLGTSIFFTNYSFSQNIIRLGTNEPYQVIFLSLFSFLYLKNRKLLADNKTSLLPLVFLLIWALLIKENNIAILPAILFIDTGFKKENISIKTFYWVVVPFLTLVMGILISKLIPSVISLNIPQYASNYSINLLTILGNMFANIRLLLNSTSPFLKLCLVLSPLIYINKEIRNSLKEKKIVYWFLFSLSFLLVLTPWRFVLERYQLVSIFGLTIFMVFFLDQVFSLVKKFPVLITKRYLPSKKNGLVFVNILFYLLSSVLIINLFFHGSPINFAKTLNYQNWFASFTTFESDQVKIVAKYNDSKVYINGLNNINNWEFLYEVPIHLEFLYGLQPNVELLENPLPKTGYIFSRHPFDSQTETEELDTLGYELIEDKFYSIDQIDPIKFKEKFVLRPIRTLLDPPLFKNKFEYYWEIQKLKI